MAGEVRGGVRRKRLKKRLMDSMRCPTGCQNRNYDEDDQGIERGIAKTYITPSLPALFR